VFASELGRAAANFLEELARDWDGTRVLVVGHSATRWALDHLLAGAALHDLVAAPFDWREGWSYELPQGRRLAVAGEPPGRSCPRPADAQQPPLT
jgi:broad specificity phosphatase PhoE